MPVVTGPFARVTKIVLKPSSFKQEFSMTTALDILTTGPTASTNLIDLYASNNKTPYVNTVDGGSVSITNVPAQPPQSYEFNFDIPEVPSTYSIYIADTWMSPGSPELQSQIVISGGSITAKLKSTTVDKGKTTTKTQTINFNPISYFSGFPDGTTSLGWTYTHNSFAYGSIPIVGFSRGPLLPPASGTIVRKLTFDFVGNTVGIGGGVLLP
jgi:hypothetical protein